MIRFIKWLGVFLDKRFPEKITAEEAISKMSKLEERVKVLEDQHNSIVSSIGSLKMAVGVRSAMGIE